MADDLASRPFERWFPLNELHTVEMTIDWGASEGVFQRQPTKRTRIERTIDFANERARVTVYDDDTVLSYNYIDSNRAVEYDTNTDRRETDTENTFGQNIPTILGVGTEEELHWTWETDTLAVSSEPRQAAAVFDIPEVQHGAFHDVSAHASFADVSWGRHPIEFHATLMYDHGVFDERVTWELTETAVQTLDSGWQ